MKKPFYKHWIFWAIVIVVAGGIIGLTTGDKAAVDQTVPAATEDAQPAADPAGEASAEPGTAPTDAIAPSPSAEAAAAGTSSINWESAIKQIAASDTAPTQKADAAEILARDYKPSAEELQDFESQIVEEYSARNYLAHIEDAEYMLTNIFKAVVVERTNEGTPIGDFAFDFHQNSKYTFLGADAPDSDAVKSNEEQMQKALDKIK